MTITQEKTNQILNFKPQRHLKLKNIMGCTLYRFRFPLFVESYCLCFILFSDPYCKVKLFRGDREFGEIDSVVTETIKKVRVKCIIFILNCDAEQRYSTVFKLIILDKYL